jgi:hypothetical protein
MIKQFNYKSTLWHIYCAKCNQRYEQKSVFAPSLCGACGSKWVAVISRADFLKESHIPALSSKT